MREASHLSCTQLPAIVVRSGLGQLATLPRGVEGSRQLGDGAVLVRHDVCCGQPVGARIVVSVASGRTKGRQGRGREDRGRHEDRPSVSAGSGAGKVPHTTGNWPPSARTHPLGLDALPG